MQLLMRRPEISGFISAAPPANTYDFSFLAPCPSSGLIINGSNDRLVPPADVSGLLFVSLGFIKYTCISCETYLSNGVCLVCVCVMRLFRQMHAPPPSSVFLFEINTSLTKQHTSYFVNTRKQIMLNHTTLRMVKQTQHALLKEVDFQQNTSTKARTPIV